MVERRGSDVLLAVATMALAAGLLAYIAGAFSVDTWLALVGGREVWQSGIPQHETLTALAHGKDWIDQQWLSEFASYALSRAGGLPLLGVASVTLIGGAVAGAIAAARRLGASAKAVMFVLPVCVWLMIPSREVRTQEFVLPLFAATVYLLARDSRRPSRQVYWCLPLLALWANLHGTVSLGATLVALRGVTLAWERRRDLATSARAWRRPLALILGGPACMLAMPYGFGALSYYRTMLLGSTVRHAVTEWQPITSAAIVAVPFFAAAAFAVWSFGRHGERTTSWEKLALLAMAGGSVMVIRNLLFFAPCALVVLPLSLTVPQSDRTAPSAEPAAKWRGTINAILLAIAAAVTVIAAAATLVTAPTRFEYSYQRAALLKTVERATAADPKLKVLADVRFADWLLWRDPALRGRVANDARFELLSPTQVQGLQRVFAAMGPTWTKGARGFRLVVLDRRYAPDAAHGFLAERGRQILYDDGNRLVVLRARSQAG